MGVGNIKSSVEHIALRRWLRDLDVFVTTLVAGVCRERTHLPFGDNDGSFP